jgi:hypothetical protein
MDKSKESTNDRAKSLREISKSILIRKGIKHSPAFLTEGAGRDVEKALKFGAFNRPEHTFLRTQVEQALSQKKYNPYISAWSEIALQLKYKRPPSFPTNRDIGRDFSADCEIVAKAISDEAEAIEQSETASGGEAGETEKPVETERDKASSTTQKHPKFFGDTITTPVIGLEINWRVCWDKLKNLPKAIRKFLSGRN